MGSLSGLLLAVSLAGCAAFVCEPLTVVVAKKQARARLETVPRELRVTETGRVEEVQQPTIARDYWVQAEAGTWYRVSAAQFQAAEVNGPLELCR